MLDLEKLKLNFLALEVEVEVSSLPPALKSVFFFLGACPSSSSSCSCSCLLVVLASSEVDELCREAENVSFDRDGGFIAFVTFLTVVRSVSESSSRLLFCFKLNFGFEAAVVVVDVVVDDDEEVEPALKENLGLGLGVSVSVIGVSVTGLVVDSVTFPSF